MNDILEIFLITFNRRNHLKVTLDTIFSEKSPLKKYSVKILDNNSNDGTMELCKEYEKKYNNFTYIKNNRNVGLAGNICKAMEQASKKYFWILCDNDKLDFSAWDEVESAMSNHQDLILVCKDYYEGKKGKAFDAFVLNQITFLPAGIYKSEHLTDNVMSYAIADTHTVLPHVPLGCAILNKGGSVSLISKSIVTLTSNVKIEDRKNYDFDRLEKDNSIDKNERVKSINFYTGIVTSFDSCRDKETRNIAIRNLVRKINHQYGPFINIPILVMSKTPGYIKQELFEKVPFDLKLLYFILTCLKPLMYIIYFYYSGNGLGVCIFSKLKIRLFSPKWFNNKQENCT